MTRVPRVLLAEDDPAIAEPLARALTREGYGVLLREDGAGALAAARDGVDLVVLDLGLPDVDGLEVCRRLRAEGLGMPVLVLTARAEEVDTVVGLDAGADDYVTKPFRLAELLARVRALLRRGDAGQPPAGPGEETVLEARGVRLDTASRRAWVGQRELSLAAKEYEVLRVLLRQAGTVVTREELMQEVWGADLFSSSKTLDMHVSWLRRKLGDPASAPRLISTVRGVGFRFEQD